MMDTSNVVTYETFRKFQKLEKDNDALQKLPEDFYKACSEWIARKEYHFEKTRDPSAVREIENVMQMVKDIMDRRERKIMLMAMHCVRTSTLPQNLLPEEETSFEVVTGQLRRMRDGVLHQMKSGANAKTETAPEIKAVPAVAFVKSAEKQPLKIDGYKLVKVLSALEQFVGTDGKIYGPLKTGDIITLPEDVAEMLVAKNRVEAASPRI